MKKSTLIDPAARAATNKSNLRLLYFLALLLAVTSALPAYIESSFLGQFVSLSWVGWFFVAANAATVVMVSIFPKIIKRWQNYYVLRAVLLGYFLSLAILMVANSAPLAFIGIVLLSVFSNLIWLNMDIFVESFSLNADTGKTRALYFTCLNLGWVLAPFLSGKILASGGFRLVFLVAAALLVPYFLIVFKKGRGLKDKVAYNDMPFLKTVRNIWKNKNLRGIYLCAFLLSVFYSGAVVFVPIYLNQVVGFSWSTLSIMFSVMLLPFVFFEIPAGIIADRYIGEKEILSSGILILAAALVAFGLLESSSAVVWGALLFFSRIGAALVESMREAYFFKIVDVQDVDYINVFRTANPLGYVAGSALGAVIAAYLSLPSLFVIFGLIMLTGLFAVYIIKDTK